MIYFLSNHKDTSFLRKYFKGEEVEVIPHPLIEFEWTENDIYTWCSDVIAKAVNADILIMNGDYTLVGIILLERSCLGKKTGFLAMKKMNEPCSERDADGKITYRNVVKPVGVRWI